MRTNTITSLGLLSISWLNAVLGQAQDEPAGISAATDEEFQQASAGQVIEPRAAFSSCADGATEYWYIFWNSEPSDYAGFSLTTDKTIDGYPLAQRYGTFSYLYTDSVLLRKWFKVRRPRYLPSSVQADHRLDTIYVTNYGVIQSNFDETTVTIYRAPILFVHGLYGTVNSFDGIREDIIASGLFPEDHLFDVNIGQGGSLAPMATNTVLLRQTLANSLAGMVADGIWVKRAYVVGHSLGGLLGRLYTGSLVDAAPYEGNVHALFTLNTPHSGSEVANYVVTHPSFPNLCWMSEDLCTGSIPELRTNGPMIDNVINGSQMNNTGKVPCRSMTSTVPTAQCRCAIDQIPLWDYIFDDFTCAGVFGSSAHDGMVKTISQRGGLLGVKTYSAATQCHMGAGNNQYYAENLLFAMCNDPRGTLYSQFGFPAYNLPMLADGEHGTSGNEVSGAQQALRGGGGLSIDAPTDGSTVPPASTIPVELSCTGEVTYWVLHAEVNGGNSIMLDSVAVGSAMIFSLPLPTDWFGSCTVKALAMDGQFQSMGTDSVVINISDGSVPTELNITPSVVYVPLDAISYYEVHAIYPGGFDVDVTSNGGTALAVSNPGSVQLLEHGVLRGLAIDTVELTALSGGLVTTAQVIVYGPDTANQDDAAFTADQRYFCDGNGTVQFEDLSGGTPDALEWWFPGGQPSTSSSPDPTVQYDAPGSYDVRLIASYGAYSDSLLVEDYIVVEQAEVPTVALIGGALVTSLTDSPQYIWYLDGAVLSYDSGFVFTPLVTGEYSVEVVSEIGCAAQSEPLYVELSTGLSHTVREVAARLYPNPAESELWVEAKAPVLACTVTNALGEAVLSTSLAGTLRFSLPLGRLCAGAYAVSLQFAEREGTVLRFVKH